MFYLGDTATPLLVSTNGHLPSLSLRESFIMSAVSSLESIEVRSFFSSSSCHLS